MKSHVKGPRGKPEGAQPGGAPAARSIALGEVVHLSNLLGDEALLDIEVSTKDELLRALARVVFGVVAPETVERIYTAVQERESSVNTYVGEGVAIPHARLDCVSGLRIAIARNPSGFPYGLVTDEPVRLVLLVVGNESLRDAHVHLLAALADILKDPQRREEILRAPDVGAVRQCLESSPRERRRPRPRPLSQVLLSYARRIGQELGVKATIICTEDHEEVSMLKRIPGSRSFVLATSSRGLLDQAEKRVRNVLLLPQVRVRRDARIRLAVLMALAQGLVRQGDIVAVLSGDQSGGLDSLTILETGHEFGRFVAASGGVSEGVLPAVLERVLTLATELAMEGREGKPLGTIFVVGDPERIGPYCQQMVMNPFRGYPEEERNILDPTLGETIKEFAAIDGAFVLGGDGVVVSAGTYLKVSREANLPGGYGSRHRAACGITDATEAIAIAVSQSTGEVTMFKNGSAVLSLPRSHAR